MGTAHDPELDRAYQVGISTGLEMASVMLLAEAKDMFTLGKDDQAVRLRTLAELLKKRSQKEHPGARA